AGRARRRSRGPGAGPSRTPRCRRGSTRSCWARSRRRRPVVFRHPRTRGRAYVQDSAALWTGSRRRAYFPAMSRIDPIADALKRWSTKLPEAIRLLEDARREKNWKRWGPYLSERQWGTVREDYSASGDCWSYFPHDHARSRAYRWGEDGILGVCDREGRLCFAIALWNERDPILKERLFGLGGPEGNHGEDVKEVYYYEDATPTSRYLRYLYRYPQRAFPYSALVEGNA